MNKVQFQKYQTMIATVLLACFFLINGFINATTVLMEAMRQPQLPFQHWEPFVWEYSSAMGSFFILLWLSRTLLQYPWNWQRPLLSVAQYCLMAIIFSAAHIAFMILARKLIYFAMGGEYQFAVGIEQWQFELLYEMRKDIWSFVSFVILIWSYRYIVAQWLGDTMEIKLEHKSHTASTNNEENNDLLLVKKLGREFLINKQDIEWIESSGNYLNLHMGDDVYPMRDTFKGFLDKNTHLSLRRVHRSYAVNLSCVDNISLTTSGDGAIELVSGVTVKMSRRYKLQLD